MNDECDMTGMTGGSRLLVLAITLVLTWPATLLAAGVSAPREVQVFDTPNDGGGGLTVTWAPEPGEGPSVHYHVMLAEAKDGAAAKQLAEFPANSHYAREVKNPWWTRPVPKAYHQYDIKTGKGVELKDGTAYVVTLVMTNGEERVESQAAPAAPGPNWINWNQTNNLLLVLIFGGILFVSIQAAKKREIFLRRIAGLDAVDEAIGRATELGKPILYLTGAGDMSEPSTIAAAVILGRVAKRVAAYETDLMVPHRDPIVM
nr:hypothetical protein [Nitrospirota bacterium]